MTNEAKLKWQVKLFMAFLAVGFVSLIWFAPVAHKTHTDYVQALEHRKSLGKMMDAWREITTPLYITDENGKILFCNVRAAKQVGYSRSELIDSNVSILVPEKYMEKHLAGMAAGIKSRRAHTSNVDCELTSKDQTEIPVSIVLDLCTLNDEMIYIVRTPERDPTAKKLEEKAKL